MIRKLEKNDIDRVMNIWLKITVKAHNFIEKKYWQDNYDTVKNIYIPMADTYVYEKDEIKGFISIINNEFIGALFVDNESQGQGIGKALIRYVQNKYGVLNLAVYKDNYKSVEFYKKVGFKIKSENINEDTNFPEYIMENKVE